MDELLVPYQSRCVTDILKMGATTTDGFAYSYYWWLGDCRIMCCSRRNHPGPACRLLASDVWRVRRPLLRQTTCSGDMGTFMTTHNLSAMGYVRRCGPYDRLSVKAQELIRATSKAHSSYLIAHSGYRMDDPLTPVAFGDGPPQQPMLSLEAGPSVQGRIGPMVPRWGEGESRMRRDGEDRLQDRAQFSTRSSETRENSDVLFVTKVASRCTA